ncbi:MAG TPA: MerR family transcriptional regulator [Acidimicrobiales bacterium]|jgi:DNA-binding transcriptional MerR regulator
MTTTEPTHTIAEVAERVGVTAHTLRYYERIGLLGVGRDAGGRRRYTDQDVARVIFITKLRAADLPIGRIQHYFALVAQGPHTEPERLALLEQHRDEIRSRLHSLESALATIEFKIARYGGTLGTDSSACGS